jgi:hypothetical protein
MLPIHNASATETRSQACQSLKGFAIPAEILWFARVSAECRRRSSAAAEMSPPVGGWTARRFAIRPDIDVKIVRRHSQSYAATAVAVHLAYHFEEHPLAPFKAR